MKSSHKQFSASNRPLVPLVQQSYVNDSVNLFQAANEPPFRAKDTSIPHSASQSTPAYESRLECGRFLQDLKSKKSPASPTKDRDESEVYPHESQLLEDPRDHRSAAQGLGFELRRRSRREGNLSYDANKALKSNYILMGSRHSSDEEQDASALHFGRGAGEDEIEKEVDISTYVREQRKIIKKVSSGSKIPLAQAKLSSPEVHYEIKEFKKEPVSSAARYVKSRKNLQASRDEHLSTDLRRVFLPQTNLRKESRDVQLSKINLRKILDGAQAYKTHETEFTKETSQAESISHNFRSRFNLGKSSQALPYESEPVTRIRRRDNFERVDSSLVNGYRSNAGQDPDAPRNPFEHRTVSHTATESIRHQARKLTEPSTPPDFYLGRGREPLMPASKAVSRLEINPKPSKHHTSETLHSPKPKAEVVIVGESESHQNLAALFKKRVKKKPEEREASRAEDSSVWQKSRNVSLEFSKQDLVKRRMEYGKKKDKTDTRTNLLDKSVSSELTAVVGLGKTSSQAVLRRETDRQQSSPKQEVLERLARGIKPKVQKKEIHEITKRHLEKFQKLNNKRQPQEQSSSKKADLIERRNKVKELDLVKAL